MERTVEDIRIREFKKEDLEAVANIVLHSFKRKVYSLASLSDEMTIELLKESGFVENHPCEGYLVAEKNDEILGVMLLKWKGQSRAQTPNELSIIRLGNKYGFKNVIKLLFGLLIMDEDVSDNECYIEHIAVSPKSRGLGIGTMLINHGKKIVEKKTTLNKYTLYVAESNISAIRLYKKLNFSEEKRKNSIMTQLLFKEKSWIYMANNI